jgi:anti-sigma factor RsiW
MANSAILGIEAATAALTAGISLAPNFAATWEGTLIDSFRTILALSTHQEVEARSCLNRELDFTTLWVNTIIPVLVYQIHDDVRRVVEVAHRVHLPGVWSVRVRPQPLNATGCRDHDVDVWIKPLKNPVAIDVGQVEEADRAILESIRVGVSLTASNLGKTSYTVH